MQLFPTCAALAVTFAASLASAAPHAAPASAAATRQAGAAALRYIGAEMRERQIPGLQVVVIRDNKVVLSKALGIASLQQGTRVGDASLFSINSATKTFTGVAVMQLAEQGKLALDAPLSAYLPGMPAAWQQVTVAQLLNHSSGIPDIIDQSTSRMIAPGEEAAWTAVQALPMQFAPGARFSYNQTNYLLLGRIIDKLAGQPFADFIARRQFDVAGMPHTRFGDSRDVIPARADAYRPGRGAVRYTHAVDEFPPPLRTGAGIITSAGELARWLIALQQGKLLAPASVQAMWRPAAYGDGSPGRWAQGWPVVRAAGHRAVAGIGGRRSAFYVYPDDGLAVIILCNLAGGEPETMLDAVAGFYLPALRRAHGGAETALKLRQQTARSGFEDLDASLRALRGKTGLPNPGEASLNSWGYRLLAQGRVAPAVAVLGLTAGLYPDSWNAHDSLAEAHEAAGARALAIAHYRRSLDLDAGNSHAAERLRALAAP